MEKIVYVTGNYGKYISVKEKFEQENIEIDFYNYDFQEPNINDIEFVSKSKAIEIYNILKKPCFVADTGFYINDYPEMPGYPGAFVKRSGVSTDIDSLLEKLKDTKNRSCYFLDCLTFYDGINFYVFYGKSEGDLSYTQKGEYTKKSKSKLWHIFIPKGQNKTLAQMNDEERNSLNKHHTSATIEFINWYKNVYLKPKQMKVYTKK
ncbi:MAG: non-canonical purine NTP pyrophosphatase [Mycoplasmatota bacterium]